MGDSCSGTAGRSSALSSQPHIQHTGRMFCLLVEWFRGSRSLFSKLVCSYVVPSGVGTAQLPAQLPVASSCNGVYNAPAPPLPGLVKDPNANIWIGHVSRGGPTAFTVPVHEQAQ